MDPLELADAKVIQLYEGHATHEQFHSEFKTDLDIERLPAGKFATHDRVLAMAARVYHILRHIELIDPHAPVRHEAKRRRIRTVRQELMDLAARLVHHGRQWAVLRFDGFRSFALKIAFSTKPHRICPSTRCPSCIFGVSPDGTANR